MAQTTSTIIARGDIVGNITSFRRHLAAANRSPRTIKTYLEAARLLADFIAGNGMPADVGKLKREHVESFIEDQLNRWTPNTAANRYRSLQQFFKFLVDEGEIKNSPMDKMKPPKQPEVLTPVLDTGQLEKLLRVCQGQSFEDRRDLALIRVFVTTGVRRAECVGLRVSDDPAQKTSTSIPGRRGFLAKGAVNASCRWILAP